MIVHILSVVLVHALTFPYGILEDLCTAHRSLLLILINVGEMKAAQPAVNPVLAITKKGA